MSIIDKIKLNGTTYDVGKIPDTTLTQPGQAADSKVTGEKIRDIIKYNSFDLMRLFGTFTSRTSGGVTYTWNEDNTVCTAVGTTTGISVTYVYNKGDIPDGMTVGETYHIKCKTTNENLFLEIIAYENNTNLKDVFFVEDSDFTIPENATKLVIRVRTRYVSNSPSTVNASISASIFNAKTNAVIEKNILEIQEDALRNIEGAESGTDAPETKNDLVFVKNTENLFSGLTTSVYAPVSEHVLTRQKGDNIAPLAGQSAIPAANAPTEDLISVIKSYVGRSGLVYGGHTTLFDEVCADGQIDCSTFVCAVLYGINYANSRYVLGTNSSNKIAEFCGDNLMNYTTFWSKYISYRMAQFYANQRRLFKVPSNRTRALHVLRFGDLLFMSNDDGDYYNNIHHVMFVLGTIPRSNAVIVAQAGSGNASKNEDTAVSTGVITLTADNIQDNYRFFARPNYQAGQLPEKKDRLQINTSFSTTHYQPIVASYGSATINYMEVSEGNTVTYTGSENSQDGIPYSCAVWFYDSDLNYLSRSYITNNPAITPSTAEYCRFTFSIPSNSERHIYLSDLDNFNYAIN